MLARFAALGGAVSELSFSDVFSTTLYTGNNANRTINNGLDLSGNGGLVWIKARGITQQFLMFDTVRGAGNAVYSASTTTQAKNASFTGFVSNGFTLGPDAATVNDNGTSYLSWSFRKAPKFFDVKSFTRASGVTSTINLSSLGSVGMVFVKQLNAIATWYAWHISLTAGNNLHLETTAAQSTSGAYLSVSGTTASLSSVAPPGDYIVYAFAHDSASDGMIKCGSFVSNSSGVGAFDTGWANGAQLVLLKSASVTGNWEMIDTARTPAWTGNDEISRVNLADAETTAARLSASGSVITVSGLSASSKYVYMSIAAP